MGKVTFNPMQVDGDGQVELAYESGSIGTSEIEDGGVSGTDIADATIDPAHTTPDGDEGVSFMFVKEIDGSDVLPLLDGSTNDLWEVPANTFVTNVRIYTETAAGSAGTVNIGMDDQWDAAATDADAFVAGHDLNAQGATVMTLNDAASQTAFAMGASTQSGQTGSVTITSSGDLSASSWEGLIAIEYYSIAA